MLISYLEMVGMNNPVSKAKWVLETKEVIGIPAESLKTIAESEGIKYLFNDYPEDDWDGMLLWKGTKKAILVNTRWANSGKHNFTFAHELGHHFLEHQPSYLQNDQMGFRCTLDNIEKEQRPYETEANKFAVELLMPEDSFKFDMTGAEIDFDLITGLSNLYIVSKHACSNRILALTSKPCIIILTKGQSITSYTESRAARGFIKRMNKIPDDTAAYNAITYQQRQNGFLTCKASAWLMKVIPSNEIYECTHIHRESGTAMTILKW